MNFSENSILAVIVAGGAVYLYFLYLLVKFAFEDGNARGIPGWALALLFLIFGPTAWLIWLVLRPEVKSPPTSKGRFDLNDFRVQ